MKIALLTSTEYKNLSEDDLDLIPAFQKRGIDARPVVWDDYLAIHDQFDGALIRSTWDYCSRPFEFQKFLVQLGELKLPVYNSVETILWNMNKSYLRKFKAMGANIPRSLFELDELGKRGISEVLGSKILAKPLVGASASEIEVLDLKNPSSESRALELLASKKFFLQEFSNLITTCGEVSLVFFDRRFSHAVRKFPKNGDFRVQEKHGGETRTFDASKELISQAQRVLNLVPEKLLYARVDGIWDQETFTLMELELFEPSFYFVTKADAVHDLVQSAENYFDDSI